MSSLSSSCPRKRRSAIAVLASIGLAFGSLVVPAVAAPVQTDEAATEVAASEAARAGNKSVRVLDKTDEVTEVRANPDGSFTSTSHVRPVRVKQANNTSWRRFDLNPYLVVRYS